MGHKIGDAVRMRPGSDLDEFLGAAAPLTGIVGDVWTDRTGNCVSVVYEPVQIYAYGLPASDFVPDVPLSDAPF